MSYSNSNAGGGRVLVADDDPAARASISAAARQEGCAAVAVCDGREALRLVREESDFAACVFNVTMPYLDGVEIIKYMMTERRLMSIPVMLMSAGESPWHAGAAFTAGALVFLPKPFTSGTARSMLQILLRQAGRGRRRPPPRRPENSSPADAARPPGLLADAPAP